MTHWIILGVNFVPYAISWRFVFRKITYWYVVKPRTVARDVKIQQYTPDWSDIGYGIVGATVLSFFWPFMGAWAIANWVMAQYQPHEVAQALGGPMPTEAKQVYLEYTTKQLEESTGIGQHHILEEEIPTLRGKVV